MPTIYHRMEATGVNVLKTVTDEVVYGLLEELDLSRYFEDAVYTMSSFMASSDFSDGSGQLSLVRNRCDVEASYIMDKSQVPWPVDSPYTTPAYGRRSTTAGNHTPIFADPKAGILIEHETDACAIELNFGLTFVSFDDACKAFDAIQTRYKGSLMGPPFHLAFDYPVPMELMMFLIAVYEAKLEYKNQPKEKFLDYLNKNKQTEISFNVRKSQLGQDDAQTELAIRSQQLNCLMQFTMDQKEPDANRQEGLPDFYKISFQATIQFGRPTRFAVSTPVSVDNTVLPEYFFKNIGYEAHYTPVVAGVYQDLMCNEFMRRSYGNFNHTSQLVHVPSYDDWLTFDSQYKFFEYRPFLVHHFTLDGPETILDLRDLGDIQLHDIVKNIMKETEGDIFNYGALFHIGVYADDVKLGNDLVSIDTDLRLKVHSNRPDKVYHLVVSETTNLFRTDGKWDSLLIKYRYFFPMTIERNIKALVDKKFFLVGHEDKFLNLINRLSRQNRVKFLLTKMVEAGEFTNEIFQYTQNATQLADFLVATQSQRENYILPDGTDPASVSVQTYYTTKASVAGRSLFVAFMEQCLLHEYITVDGVPTQYLDPNRSAYPYYSGVEGYYGFNTPIRVFNYTINA